MKIRSISKNIVKENIMDNSYIRLLRLFIKPNIKEFGNR